MNILLVDQVHFLRGGAETVYLKSSELLEKHGHKCYFFSMHDPRNFSCDTSEYFVSYVDLNAQHNFIQKLKIAARIIYSVEARRNISRLLDRYSIDLAHLHNIYHNISPSILPELKKRGIPVVQTLHDLKLVCGQRLMFADGMPCEDCRGIHHYRAIRRKCVKNSRLKSLLTAVEMYLHHNILNIFDNVDIFVAPSLHHRKKFIEMGVKKEVVFLPNFFQNQEIRRFKENAEGFERKEKNSIVFAGRISEEKGLSTLLDAANRLQKIRSNVEIKIIGSGPMMGQLQDKVERENTRNVRFLGSMEHQDLYRELLNSIALVLPTVCYENNPMTVIEAFALGRPVIGSRIGGIPELVRDQETGLTFQAGNADDLLDKMLYMIDHPEDVEIMGLAAKEYIEKNLTADRHYQGLMEIYEMAISRKGRGT